MPLKPNLGAMEVPLRVAKVGKVADLDPRLKILLHSAELGCIHIHINMQALSCHFYLDIEGCGGHS